MSGLRLAFQKQRGQARFRGIDFTLSFEEWFFVWELSGHLHERGRKKGQYVMARQGDEGPYAIDNVDIMLCSQNCADGNYGPSPLQGRKVSESHRAAIVKSLIGRTMSTEARAKIGAANSANHTGKPWSEARRAAQAFIVISDEARVNMSACRVGKPWSEARRAAQAMITYPSWSEETRARHAARHARKREAA